MTAASRTVNSYVAVLFVTAFGALAAWTIVRVAYRAQPTVVSASGASTEASFARLQQSILQGSK